MNGACNSIFPLPPGALWRGQKIKYHYISTTKSISKIFMPHFVYLLTNLRYKTYQTGFSFDRLGHAPGLGLGGAGGGGGNFFSVMRYIKFKGMVIRTGTSKKITKGSNW